MYYGLDVHKEFIQVCCINPSNTHRKDWQIPTTRESIEKFSDQLTAEDHAVLEATFNSWSVYTLLASTCEARIVIANAREVKAIAHARVKTDKVDAHILAQLLRTDFIPEVAVPSDVTWEIRQLGSHRKLLVKHRTAVKNSIHGILNKNLIQCPYPSPFTQKGIRWLKKLEQLKPFEELMRDHLLRQLELLQEQIDTIEEEFKQRAQNMEDIKLLMTIPGVGVTVATGLRAAIDDVNRFKTPDQLASYFGLVPRIRQSASNCYYGSITKEGTAYGRWLAIEAAQSLALTPGPIAASYHRIRRKKGHNVAVTALARKLIVLSWHMLKKRTPYRYAEPERTYQKLLSIDPHRAEIDEFHVARKKIDHLYEFFELNNLKPSSAEQRAAANNRREMTRLKKNSSKTQEEKTA